MTYWGLLLALLYIFISYLAVRYTQRKYYKHDAYLSKKLMQGFWVKMLAGILYVFLIQFYYGGGYSFMYFGLVRIMHNSIIQNPSNLNFLFPSSPPCFMIILKQQL